MDRTRELSDTAQAAIEQLQALLAALEPFADSDIAKIWPEFENDVAIFTYATNAVEGSTLTLAETTTLLELGVTAGAKPMKDHIDAKNGALAYVKMLDYAKAKTAITVDLVRDLHRLLSGPDKVDSGEYKTLPNRIIGSDHVTTAVHKVSGRMTELIEQFQNEETSKTHPLSVAAKLHYDLVNIHPFSDYNGRTARLLMNLHLIQSNYAPIIVGLPERVAYLEALEVSSKSGNPLYGDPGRGHAAPFTVFVAEMEARSIARFQHILSTHYNRDEQK